MFESQKRILAILILCFGFASAVEAGVTRSRTVTRETVDAPAPPAEASSPTPIEAVDDQPTLGAATHTHTYTVRPRRVFSRVYVATPVQMQAVQVQVQAVQPVQQRSSVVSTTRTRTSTRCQCGCNKRNCNCQQ